MRKTIFYLFALALLPWLPTATAAAGEGVTLTISDCNIATGGRATLTIESDIALGDYCGFQFDLLLPEGVTIPYNLNTEEEEEGYWYYDNDTEAWKRSVESGITKTSHTLSCEAVAGGYRFVCFNTQLAHFKTGSRTVLTLTLEASAGVTNGVYLVALANTMKIADEDGSVVPTFVEGTCVITGGSQTTTYSYTLSAAGYGTLMLPFNAEVPQGLAALECGSVQRDEELLVLSQSPTLLANTPYLMTGTPGTYTFTGLSVADRRSYTNGLFVGVYVPTVIDDGYVLQRLDGTVAFYKVQADKPVTVPAYHCYMVVSGASGAPAYHFDRPTGIGQAETGEGEEELYDLSGKKLEGKSKGVVISNRKKILVK